MGTYTTNYQLFMPTVGETGWGTLVNGNFTTIDTTMKGLSNRITAVENEVNGNLSCTTVTTSGKVTGNGGIAGTTGTFSGVVTAPFFNGKPLTYTAYITTYGSYAYNIPIWGNAGNYGGVKLYLCRTNVGDAIAPMVYVQNNITVNVHFTTLFLGLGSSDASKPVSISKFVNYVDDLSLSMTVPTSYTFKYNGRTYGGGSKISFTVDDINNICINGIDLSITTTDSNSLPELVIEGASADRTQTWLVAY